MAASEDGTSSGRTAAGFRWWAHPRQLLRYLLSLDDTPHRISLGLAIGTFIAFTPTVGVQMVIAGAIWYLCRPLFRFNCKAALVAVYISNPVTTIPIYWGCYCLGRVFVGGDLTREQFAAIFRYSSFDQWWSTVSTLFFEIGGPLLLGSAIVATVAAVIAYPCMLFLLKWLQGRGARARTARAPAVQPAVQTAVNPSDESADETAG
jgi:hypothetical protein